MPHVLVQLDVPESPNIITNFNSGQIDSDPSGSFLQVFEHLEALSTASGTEAEALRSFLDEHQKPGSLSEVDVAFEKLLVNRLKSIAARRLNIDSFVRQTETHRYWLSKCNDERSKRIECRMEKLREEWEYRKRLIFDEARKKWENVTGVVYTTRNDSFDAKGKLFYSFQLNAKEGRWLQIQYGPSSVRGIKSEISSSVDREPTRVVNAGDLTASSLGIFLKYHPAHVAWCFGGIVLCLAIALPALRPVSLLPVHKIFNFALRTNDTEAWAEASKQYKYHIMQRYRALCSTLRKDVSLAPEDVFDYIRDRLRVEYKEEKLLYDDEAHLSRFVELYLRRLVVNA